MNDAENYAATAFIFDRAVCIIFSFSIRCVHVSTRSKSSVILDDHLVTLQIWNFNRNHNKMSKCDWFASNEYVFQTCSAGLSCLPACQTWRCLLVYQFSKRTFCSTRVPKARPQPHPLSNVEALRGVWWWCGCNSRRILGCYSARRPSETSWIAFPRHSAVWWKKYPTSTT